MSTAREAALRAAICAFLALLATALVALLPGASAWAAPPGGVSAHASSAPAR